MLKGVWFIALELGDFCLVNSSADLVSVYITLCYLGKIFEISSKLIAVISHNFYFSLCSFCHMVLISWLKNFPFKMSVLLYLDALPKWCELKSSGSAWRAWSLAHFAKFLLFFRDDCALLHVIIS